MRFRPSHPIDIDNLRGYPVERVDQLRALLSELTRACREPDRGMEGSDIIVRPDPRRDGFYDLEVDGRVFYIHVSPVNGKILLLATWHHEAAPSLDNAATRLE
ncbi:MAG: hypothetical protein ACE5H2_06815 [Terriglobia bacterium]